LEVHSLLVIVTRQIGDLLLTTPLIRRARETWPAARIAVLGIAGTVGMLRGNPDVDELIEVPAHPGLRGWLGLARRLLRRYDLALIGDLGDRAHLIGLVAARRRAGIVPARSESNWWKRRLLAHAVESAGDRGERHVVAEKVQLLAPWAKSGAGAPAVVPPPPADLPPALQERLAPGYVVMHTPSMWPYKQWPLAHYRELAALLAGGGRQVVLTGSMGTHDRACIAAMQGAATPDLLLDAGALGFDQLTRLLQDAALYIGPDTSVTHLAAACGTPVLAIFGPTNPQRWAPWPGVAAGQPVRFVRRAPVQQAGNVTLLQGPQDCVPCGRAGCEDHRGSRSDCLQDITAQQVAQQAWRLLDRDAREERQPRRGAGAARA